MSIPVSEPFWDSSDTLTEKRHPQKLPHQMERSDRQFNAETQPTTQSHSGTDSGSFRPKGQGNTGQNWLSLPMACRCF